MNIILSSFMILLLQQMQSAAPAQKGYDTFTSGKSQISIDTSFAPIINFNGTIKNDRVLLNWTIAKNNEADRIEVERSKDGKTFVMAALVFGSEELGKAEYQFYEKVKKVRPFYRLKVIKKDNTIDYSTIINPQPFPVSP